MRRLLVVAVLLTVPFAPSAWQGDPDRTVKGAALPPGWQARFDNDGATVANVKFVHTGAGFRVTSGPAAIFFRPAEALAEPLSVRAVFSQLKATAHPEAYGLFIGGANLQAANQKYTYFLIRQDGMFLIKRRAGAATPTVTDWTAHTAVKKPGTPWTMTNEIAVTTDPRNAHFLINNVEVASVPVAGIDVRGVAGVRINHNLDVRFEFRTAAK